MEEFACFQSSIKQLALKWNVPSKLVFDFIGVASSSKDSQRKGNTWTKFQSKHFAAAMEESKRRESSATPNPTEDADTSTSLPAPRKSVLNSTVGILSQWYKERNPEEEAQLLQDDAETIRGLKRKRNPAGSSMATPKSIRSETSRVVGNHLKQIVAHLNVIHTSLGLQSLVVIAGGGYQTMMTGTLVDPNLSFAKFFSQSVMPLNGFQKKIEGIVKLGEGVEEAGLAGRVRLVVDNADKAKNKPAHQVRAQEIGVKLRNIYGKEIEI